MNDDQVPSLDINKLKVLTPLGRGAKGVVFLVQNDGELLALKVISRASIKKKAKNNDSDGSEYKRIMFEQEVLRRFHTRCYRTSRLLSTEHVVDTPLIIVQDVISIFYVRNRPRKCSPMTSSGKIQFYAAELVLALEYLHGLVHITISETTPYPLPKKNKRVSKLYNCCYSPISADDSVHPAESVNSEPSCETRSLTKSNSFVGTEEYVAPEMIQGNGHDFAVDWWCLGVVLHEMLYGTTPFVDWIGRRRFNRILSKPADLVGEPTPLRDLIRKLLEKDPKQRITVAEIKGHDFFKGVDWGHVVQISRPPLFLDGSMRSVQS
uniref:non-specific serine/threonine protein kinase n=1 Tax=Helianthus annuus TaxID=4232 RepID=A0A251UXP4_HELAN